MTRGSIIHSQYSDNQFLPHIPQNNDQMHLIVSAFHKTKEFKISLYGMMLSSGQSLNKSKLMTMWLWDLTTMRGQCLSNGKLMTMQSWDSLTMWNTTTTVNNSSNSNRLMVVNVDDQLGRQFTIITWLTVWSLNTKVPCGLRNGFRHKITTKNVTKSIPRFAHIFRGSFSLDTMRLIKLKVFVNYIYDHLVMTLPMIHLRPSGQAFANI